MLVSTRFGLRVRNREWLEHRLILLSAITAPSLLAQHDPHFYWIIHTDDILPASIYNELQEIIEPFGDRAFLFERPFHSQQNLVEMVMGKQLEGATPYLLTGRIDDDDAWSVGMVGAVRKYVAEWLAQDRSAPGVNISFQDGLEWIMYGRC